MIGGLNVAAIAFGLAACAVTFAVVELVDGALHWIENRSAPQPDEAQLLLAALCEQVHERLQAGRHAAAHRHQPDGGTMAGGHQAMTDDHRPEWLDDLPERIHHPAHRRVLPIFDLNPVL
jgi:hypothetical protein